VSADDERRFPIIPRYGSKDPRWIPWADAARAYEAYERLYSNRQTLDVLAARGGFGYLEYLALNDVAVWLRAHPMATQNDLRAALDIAFHDRGL
jgi:hypothetical protein